MAHYFRMKKSGKNQLVKTISTALVCTFLFQELAFANPNLLKVTIQGITDTENSKSWARKLLPAIPESVAVIEDAYKSTDSNKTLILIQDAHTNNSGQLNVAKTLDLISRKGPFKYVFLEAGSGNESLSFLRKYASEDKRKEVAKSFLMNGKLQGTEYLDLTSKHNFILWGVEDLGLYTKSVATYRFVAKEREKFEQYLGQIESTIKTLKPKIYNPFLLAFDEKYQKFQKEEISLINYYEILTNEARKANISFESFPHLKALNKLKEIESKIDFKKANEEEQMAVSSLSSQDQQELLLASADKLSASKLSVNEHQVQKAFFALLEEKIASRLNQYTELSKYLQYLKEAKKIQAKSILEEQKVLEKEVFKTLSRNEDEENLIKASKNLESLKKLFNLTLTPDEFDAYQKDKQSFDIAHLTGFLNKKIMDLKDHYEKAVFLESGYEDVIKKCEEFYSLTYDRDRKFIENLTKKMNAENEKNAVLITGGYHTPNLKYLLKDQGISYINITPQVLQETNQKRYERLLLSQNIDLAQSLNAVSNPVPNNFGATIHTNMLMRILQMGRFGIPYDSELAQNLGTSPVEVNKVLEAMRKREKELGGPLAGAGGIGSVGGRPVEQIISKAKEDEFDKLRREEKEATKKTKLLSPNLVDTSSPKFPIGDRTIPAFAGMTKVTGARLATAQSRILGIEPLNSIGFESIHQVEVTQPGEKPEKVEPITGSGNRYQVVELNAKELSGPLNLGLSAQAIAELVYWKSEADSNVPLFLLIYDSNQLFQFWADLSANGAAILGNEARPLGFSSLRQIYQNYLSSKIMRGIEPKKDFYNFQEKGWITDVNGIVAPDESLSLAVEFSGARLAELKRVNQDEEKLKGNYLLTLASRVARRFSWPGIATRTASSTASSLVSTDASRSLTSSMLSPSAVWPSATTRNLDSNRSTSAATSLGVNDLGSLDMRTNISNNPSSVKPAPSVAITSGARLANKTVQELAQLLKSKDHHRDYQQQLNAARTLGDKGIEAIPYLIQFLEYNDRISGVSSIVKEALVKIGATYAVPKLIKALGNKNRDIRSGAAYVLGEIGSPQANAAFIPLIEALEEDNDILVRVNSAIALGEIGSGLTKSDSGKSVPALIRALKDKNWYIVRLNAAEALGKINTRLRATIPALVRALTAEEDYLVRQTIIKAIGNIGPAAIPALERRQQKLLELNSQQPRDKNLWKLEAIRTVLGKIQGARLAAKDDLEKSENIRNQASRFISKYKSTPGFAFITETLGQIVSGKIISQNTAERILTSLDSARLPKLDQDYPDLIAYLRRLTSQNVIASQSVKLESGARLADETTLSLAENALRKPIIGGNLKLEFDSPVAHEELVREIAVEIKSKGATLDNLDIFIAPQNIHIAPLHRAIARLEETREIPSGLIKLGAQNVSEGGLGAHTSGLPTAQTLKNSGVEYVIIGHSETREAFNETNQQINAKIKAVLTAGLTPVLAVGESADQRKNGKVEEVIRQQVEKALEGFEAQQLINAGLVIAYEPIWAIGTKAIGVATPEEANRVQRFIRSIILEKFGIEAASKIRIQYGGSMKPDNAASFEKEANIDGGLIGGAAKQGGTFVPILAAFAASGARLAANERELGILHAELNQWQVKAMIPGPEQNFARGMVDKLNKEILKIKASATQPPADSSPSTGARLAAKPDESVTPSRIEEKQVTFKITQPSDIGAGKRLGYKWRELPLDLGNANTTIAFEEFLESRGLSLSIEGTPKVLEFADTRTPNNKFYPGIILNYQDGHQVLTQVINFSPEPYRNLYDDYASALFASTNKEASLNFEFVDFIATSSFDEKTATFSIQPKKDTGARFAIRTGFTKPEGQAKDFFTNSYATYSVANLFKKPVSKISDAIVEAIRSYLDQEVAQGHIKSFLVNDFGGTDIDIHVTHQFGELNADVHRVMLQALREGLKTKEALRLLKEGTDLDNLQALAKTVNVRANDHLITERGAESVGIAKIIGGSIGAANIKLWHEFGIPGSAPGPKLGLSKMPGFIFVIRKVEDVMNGKDNSWESRFEISHERTVVKDKDGKTQTRVTGLEEGDTLIKHYASKNESIPLLALISQTNDYVVTAVYPVEGSGLPANQPLATVIYQPAFGTNGKRVLNPTIIYRLQSGADAVGGVGSIVEDVNFVPGGPEGKNFVTTKPVFLEEARKAPAKGTANVVYYGYQSHINGRIPKETIVDHIGVNPPALKFEQRLATNLAKVMKDHEHDQPYIAPFAAEEDVESLRHEQDALFSHSPKESEPDDFLTEVENKVKSGELVSAADDKADMGGTWGHTQVPVWMSAIYKATMLEAQENGELTFGNTFGSVDYERLKDNENWGVGDDGHMFMLGDRSEGGFNSHQLSFMAFTRAYTFSSINQMKPYGEGQDYQGAEAKAAKKNPYFYSRFTPRFFELLRQVMPPKYLNMVTDLEDGKGSQSIIDRIEKGWQNWQTTGTSTQTLSEPFSGNVSQQGIGSARYFFNPKEEKTLEVLAGDKMGPSALNRIIRESVFTAVDSGTFANGLVFEIWDAKAFNHEGNIALNDLPPSLADVKLLAFKTNQDKDYVLGLYKTGSLAPNLSDTEKTTLAETLKRSGYVPAKRIFLDAKEDREAIIKYLADSDRFNVKHVWGKKTAGWDIKNPKAYIDRPVLASSITRLGILTGGEYVGKDDPVMVGHAKFMQYVREFLRTRPSIIQGDMNGSHWLWAVPSALKYGVATKDSHPIFVMLRYHISEDGKKFEKVEDLSGERSFNRIRGEAFKFNWFFKKAQLGGQIEPYGTNVRTVEGSYELAKILRELNKPNSRFLSTPEKIAQARAEGRIWPEVPATHLAELYQVATAGARLATLSPDVRAKLEQPLTLLAFDQDNTLAPARDRISDETIAQLSRIANKSSNENRLYFADISGGSLNHVRTHVTNYLPQPVKSLWYEAAANGAEIHAPGTTDQLNYVSLTTLGPELQHLRTVVEGVIKEKNLTIEDRGVKWTINFESGHEDEARETAEAIRKVVPQAIIDRGLSILSSAIAIDISLSNKSQAIQKIAQDIAKKLGISGDEVLKKTLMMGDAENDVEVLNFIAAKGGVAIFVGPNVPTALSPEVIVLGQEGLQNTNGVNAALTAHANWIEQGARLSSATLQNKKQVVVERKGKLIKEDILNFSVLVYDATKRTGKIAVGGSLLDIEINPVNNALIINGLSEGPVEINNYKLTVLEGRKGNTYQVSVSMTELRQTLDQDVTAINGVLGEIDESQPVIAEIDLTGFNNQDSKELVFPLLIRELNIAHKQNAVFLLKGDHDLVNEVLTQANNLYSGNQNFIYTNNEELPPGYENARRISIVAVGDNKAPQFQEGRYFVTKTLKRGEIPNFRAIFKLSLFEARIDKLETSNPLFIRFRDAYRILLGSQDINVSEFILVLSGQEKNLTIILKYAIAPHPIPFENIIRMYNMMIKMAEQAA